MFVKYIILSFILIVKETTSEKLRCQMRPVESNRGIVGHCCLFLKNISEILVHKEAIGDYKLNYLIEENGMDKISNSNIKLLEDKFLKVKGGISNVNISFPGTSHLEQNKSDIEIDKYLKAREGAPNKNINFPGTKHFELNKSDIEIDKYLIKAREGASYENINFPRTTHLEQNKSDTEIDKNSRGDTPKEKNTFNESTHSEQNKSGVEIDKNLETRGDTINEKINFPGSIPNHNEQNKSEVETEKHLKTKNDDVNFPEIIHHGQNKSSDQEIDETIRRLGLNENQNKSKSNSNVNITPDPGIAMNRNAVDSPDSCPEGTQRDHSGNCVKGF